MRGLIYGLRAACAEVLLELAFIVAPSGTCKLNMAKFMLDYARAALKETEK